MKFISENETCLITLLTQKIGYSITKAKKDIKNSEIIINKTASKEPNPVIPKGAVVEIKRKKRIDQENISILYEDNQLIAVDKPAGIISIGTCRNNEDSLFGKVNSYLKKTTAGRERAFIVHRLDQKVSGVVLLAKSAETEKLLEEHWQEYEKYYHALVEGTPQKSKGTIESWLFEDRNFKVHSGLKREGGKLAITRYEVERRFRNFTLLNVRLYTGRKNQIRVHLADIGCPIAGDLKYGASANPLGRLALHAHTFKMTHPVTGEKLVLSSPTPARFFLFSGQNPDEIPRSQ
ncbi:MAG: RluA family pseudouridine synthase [Oligoflexales bacterium]|nr:RluA family pseudouridine synthase [Oligoflexales bacterium]